MPVIQETHGNRSDLGGTSAPPSCSAPEDIDIAAMAITGLYAFWILEVFTSVKNKCLPRTALEQEQYKHA